MTSDSKDAALLAEIGAIMKDLLKVIKVVSMYPENNPLPQALRRSFAERLEQFVRDHGETVVEVRRGVIACKDKIIYEDRTKEDSLAALFFEAGISEMTFGPGLDVTEVYALLNCIKAYLNAPHKSLDLAAVFWEANVGGFKFNTVEDVALAEYDNRFNIHEYLEKGDKYGKRQTSREDEQPYDAIFDLTEVADKSSELERSEIDLGESGQIPIDDARGQAPGLGGGDDQENAGLSAFLNYTDLKDDDSGAESISFGVRDADEKLAAPERGSDKRAWKNTTVILNDEARLSEEQERLVAEMIAEDELFDPYLSALNLLREVVLQETALESFLETLVICEKIHTELIQEGRLLEAGELFKCLRQMMQDTAREKPDWAERINDSCTAIGSRDRLLVLAESLNEHTSIGGKELQRYLDNFDWQSLSGLTDLLGELQRMEHRLTLRDYLARQGRSKVDIVAKGIFDKRWYVVRNCVTILASIGDDRSLGYLKRVVDHPEPRVRKELINSLKECASDTCLGLLAEMVDDEDAEIAYEAVAAIVRRRGPAAYNAIAAVINGERFVNLPRGSQRVLLGALSELGGEEAVGYLRSLILLPNLLRDKTRAFHRQIAFEALAANPSEKARRELERLGRSLRPDIRRQARQAIESRPVAAKQEVS